jgi:integrase
MEQNLQINVTLLALGALHKRLGAIEQLLTSRVPYLLVDEAIGLFWSQHLAKTKNPRSYRFLTDKFLEAFSGRNAADISPEELEDFLLRIAEGTNTRAYRAAQLRGFFAFCNKLLMMKKAPVFQNPLDILSFPKESKDPAFIPTETVRAMAQASESLREALVVLVLASTGMRAGELAELSPEDVRGRVIIVRDPKSRRFHQSEDYTEVAVMPAYVAELLQEYLQGPRGTDRLLGNYKYIHRTIKRLAKRAGARLTPHDLRRFCATFWERQGEPAMVAFVLRHRTSNSLGDPLARFYIAPLTVEEVMEKQKAMENLFLKT